MPAKPILLTVDDDPEVLRAIERDLRRKYGKDYRVLRADAGAAASTRFGRSTSAASRLPYSWSISACLR
jgi:hypothetical protein